MNAHAVIGHNNPPSPFDAVKAHIDDLMTEARNWADGAAIENQAQADEVSRLLEDMRKARDAADEARKLEAQPFDDGKAAVQAKYAPLIADTKAQKGVCVLALESLRAVLAPWLRKLEDEKRAAAEAARRDAEEKARIAAEAMRASDAANLAEREAAEALVADAEAAQRLANKASGDKAHATGGTRAVGLRSYWTPTLTDGVAAARHYWAERRPECEAFFLSLAEKDVREGKRQIPGFAVTEERRV